MLEGALAYLRSKGLIPDDQVVPPVPSASPAPVAPPAIAGVDSVIDAPPSPPVLPPPAPPKVAAVPSEDKGYDAQDAIALGLSGLGDAFNAAAGRQTTGTKDTAERIQNAPVKAAERESLTLARKDEAEARDPNSPISVFHQKMLEKYTNKPGGTYANVSAAQIAKVFPTIEKAWQADQATAERLQAAKIAADAKTEAAQMHADTMKGIRDIAVGQKLDQRTEDRLKKLGDELDASKQRGGAFGIAQQVHDRAEGLESLANAFQANQLDQRQIEELAIGLNGMLSRSNQSAQAQTEKLVPKSLWGNVQKFTEWLANEPQGMQQQEFVKRLVGTIEREKATASAQLNRVRFQRIGNFSDLEKKAPDRFEEVIRHYGVDPDAYKAWKKGGYKEMSAVQKPEDGNDKKPQKIEAGHEEDGYRFIGGDPTDPNNWQEIAKK